METGYAHYFLSNTAMEIWQKADIEGQNKMFACLYEIHKESYFRRVIFKNSSIPEYRFRELAENAFLIAWEVFNKNGSAGKISFSSTEYTGFFFIIFKRTYLKIIGKELRQLSAEKEFGKAQPGISEMTFEI